MDRSVWRNLPPEIIGRVLSLLPVKCLCRFKCVSPSWNSLISSPHFAKTHLHITNNTPNKPQKTLLISSSRALSRDLYSVDFAATNPTAEKLDFTLPVRDRTNRVRGWGSCNGLVLVSDEGLAEVCEDGILVPDGGVNYNLFLFNPFTTEWKELPDSHVLDLCSLDDIHFIVNGVGYDSSTDDYKVVMLHSREVFDYNGISNSTRVAVYSLKTDAWSIIQVSHNWLEPQTGVYLNDRLHWLCWYNLMNAIAFDLSDQIFREIQLPDYELESECLVVLRGCLCLVCFSVFDIGTEVWMMNKYGVTESWTKFRIADPMMYIDGVLYLSAKDEFVLRALIRIIEEDGEIIVDESKEKQLVLYNPEKETVRVMIVPGIPTGFAILGNSVETLLSPNHGGQIMRQCEASSVKVHRVIRYLHQENLLPRRPWIWQPIGHNT